MISLSVNLARVVGIRGAARTVQVLSRWLNVEQAVPSRTTIPFHEFLLDRPSERSVKRSPCHALDETPSVEWHNRLLDMVRLDFVDALRPDGFREGLDEAEHQFMKFCFGSLLVRTEPMTYTFNLDAPLLASFPEPDSLRTRHRDAFQT
jgi:hypothetical protein